jgi:hypothetical protein
MSISSVPGRIDAGQSSNGTVPDSFEDGIRRDISAFMVSMMFIIGLALTVLPGSVRAEESASHVTAVAVARAQIVTGVRISREDVAIDHETQPSSRSRAIRLPKPRERPCPEPDTPPCRLIVVDMP